MALAGTHLSSPSGFGQQLLPSMPSGIYTGHSRKVPDIEETRKRLQQCQSTGNALPLPARRRPLYNFQIIDFCISLEENSRIFSSTWSPSCNSPGGFCEQGHRWPLFWEGFHRCLHCKHTGDKNKHFSLGSKAPLYLDQHNLPSTIIGGFQMTSFLSYGRDPRCAQPPGTW